MIVMIVFLFILGTHILGILEMRRSALNSALNIYRSYEFIS